MRCTQCGTEYAPEAKYCSQCAAPVTTAPTAAPEPAPAAAAGQGDRRLVTILFADISGFTSLSEKLDPEAVRDLITACFDRLVPCIQRYGGTIDKFIGDEVMALFGAPQAHENDPERALRAAIEMRDALAGFNRQHGVGLGVHFGVNTGLVYAGGVGGGGRQDYSVMGDVVNVAARLKGAAKTGEILVGGDTYRQTTHLFDFQTGEALSLKGKAEPVAVCRLLCARAAPATSERPTRGLSSPLVGRAEEMAAFQARLAGLGAGEGGIIIVTGEAGLGKSRLVAEVRSRAQREGFSWLEGRTLSFGRTISYWPLLEIIQHDAGIDSDDTEAERWAKLSGRLTALCKDEAPDILPYLATLLSLPVPEDLAQKVRYLDGEAMGRQIYRATRLYFARLAAERPTVVIFEDVHWLDGSSASLLEHLLPIAREAPILFCLVSRPEADSALTRLRELAGSEYADRLTEIALDPLSKEESATLVCNLARLEELPARLRDSILEKAEGNPFFVEEVVRSLIDLGGLKQEPGTGRFRVTEKAAHIPIPDTLQGVVMARIDRLDEELKQVLRLASVIGRSFFYRVLAGVAEADRALDQNLLALEARELVREKVREPELEYIFKHALVQEATYESILLQRRRELHGRVARAIETLFADRLEEFYSLLAYHYSKAENWEKAQDYLFKAGDQASSIAADAEVLAHYEEAVEAYTRVFGDRWDPLARAVLERKIGDALFRRGEHARAKEYLYRGLATLGSPFPASPGAVRRAIAGQLVRQVGHRLFAWHQARALTVEARRIAEERCEFHQVLGTMENYADQSKTVLHGLLSLNVAESAGLVSTAAMASAWTGAACSIGGLPRLARFYLERGLTDAERSSEPLPLAEVHWLMAVHELWVVGDWTSAREYNRQSAELWLSLGDVRGWATATCVEIHSLVEWGELEAGLARAREVGRMGQEAGDPFTEAWGQAWEGEVLYMMGSLQRGEEKMHSSLTALFSMTDYRIGAKVAGHLALCYLDQGRLNEAQALLRDHRARTKEFGLTGGMLHYLLTGLAAAGLLAVEGAAGPARDVALKEAKAACRELLKSCKTDATSLVPANRMQGSYEWLLGHPNKAERWWQKSLAHAAKLGARYEGALTRLEIGRRTSDRAQLEQAEAEFADMGAAFYLAEARRLLGRAEVAEEVAAP